MTTVCCRVCEPNRPRGGGPWAYRGLVGTRGWSLTEFETWLAETLYTQLMAEPKRSQDGSVGEQV